MWRSRVFAGIESLLNNANLQAKVLEFKCIEYVAQGSTLNQKGNGQRLSMTGQLLRFVDWN